ncbi:MAG: hypothetical protein WBV06_09700 [Acidimicrobiia bacterium]
MSCIDLNDDQGGLLAVIATKQAVPEHMVPLVDDLRRREWMMPNTLELTGTRRRHVENAGPGLLG